MMRTIAGRRKFLDTVASIMMYSTCSICMIIVNKLLMHTYDLKYPNSLLFFQNGGAFFIVAIAKALGLVEYPDFDWQIARRWLPLTVLFVLMLFTSMKSLHVMSVSTQTIMKNLALIITAAGDSVLYGKNVTLGMYGAFSLMVAGSYLGAVGDHWVTAWGLFWTFANIAVTVSYTLYMKRLLGDVTSRIGRYGPVFYNNLLSLPFFLVAGMGEFAPFLSALSTTVWQGKVCMLVAVSVSSGMTFAVFWCMEVTSPTTFSVVGALNKVPIAFLGILIFQQFPEPIGYLGIALALAGGFIYTAINIRNSKPMPPPSPPPTAMNNLKDLV